MPKMIVSIDGVVIKEVQLTKDKTSLGRRPYSDIVIDNLVVSGEHATLLMAGNDVYLEDLNSTNGTYVNGKSIKKQLLQNGDTIEIGKYKIQFIKETESSSALTVMSELPDSSSEAPQVQAAIRVVSGAGAGREMPLTKVVTTVGKPGFAVAAITRRQNSFVVCHVEGAGKPTVNGAEVGSEPAVLRNGDLIELAGTQMQFVQT